ncbi:MAG TPA: hypothetical protein VGR37_14630 [Longimicrobiaceae bacterium]|nr:hypothetical protein [Longimicrobiaceae bacterium]
MSDCWPDLVPRIRAYADTHAASIALDADPLLVRGGEDAKNSPELVLRLQASFNAAGIDRHSYGTTLQITLVPGTSERRRR